MACTSVDKIRLKMGLLQFKKYRQIVSNCQFMYLLKKIKTLVFMHRISSAYKDSPL